MGGTPDIRADTSGVTSPEQVFSGWRFPTPSLGVFLYFLRDFEISF
jgi:hypothetical protein